MKLSKTLATAAFAACLAVQANAASAQIVASVNNEIITEFDIKNMLANGIPDRNAALSILVQERLISSLAREYKISVNQLELQQSLADLLHKMQLKSSDFTAMSEHQQSRLLQTARVNVQQKKLFDHIVYNYSKKQISDEDVRKFFDENLASKGADFEHEKLKIRSFLQNQAAQESIANFMEKEQAKAKIIIKGAENE